MFYTDALSDVTCEKNAHILDVQLAYEILSKHSLNMILR